MRFTTISNVALSMLLSSTAAQTNSSAVETVLSSFVFALHGERTPPQPFTEPSLTSFGAQQSYSQGKFIRSRYLSGSPGNGTSSHPIAGINNTIPNNSQLLISSIANAWTVGSALAFTQGLFPTGSELSAQGIAGFENSSYLADGTLVEFPLGWQAPDIETLSSFDSRSIWLQGDVACPNWMNATNLDDYDNALNNQTLAMYQTIFNGILAGSFPAEMTNYNFATDLWQYAAYQYNHNATVRAGLSDADLGFLRELADVQQFNINGDLTGPAYLPDQQISAVAGRTLATRILSSFTSFVQSGGSINKLTLGFGAWAPFIALFQLMNLSASHPDGLFSRIPDYGAVMAFELFTLSELNDGNVPDKDDLRIRFLYRNGTSDDVSLEEYPLFGRKADDPALSLNDFSATVSRFAVQNLTEWCDICSATAELCTGVDGTGSSGNGSIISEYYGGGSTGQLSPTAAGLVGAGCGIGAMLLAGAIAAAFGGYRIRRGEAAGSKASAGFRGSVKLADDQDVSLAKSGAVHARAGSWELGKGSSDKSMIARSGEAAPRVTPGNPVDEGNIVIGATFMKE